MIHQSRDAEMGLGAKMIAYAVGGVVYAVLFVPVLVMFLISSHDRRHSNIEDEG